MQKRVSAAIAVAVACIFCCRPVAAADIIGPSDTSFHAMQKQGPWQIRVRASGIIPRGKGEINSLLDERGRGALGDAGVEGTLPGTFLGLMRTVMPEFGVACYMTDNLAAEFALGNGSAHITGYKQTVLDGTAYGDDTLSGEIIRSRFLLPMLGLQYHFTDTGRFRPYIGSGVGYMVFYSEKKANADPSGFYNPDIRNAWGYALQAGFDFMLDSHWGLNLDVRKLFLRTDLEAIAGEDIAAGMPVKGKMSFDSWFIGAGVTYRF